MKQVVAILALVSISQAHAQNDTVVAPQNSPTATGSPIYIMNSQTQTSAQATRSAQNSGQSQTRVSEQPASVIEDSPISLSSAEIKRRKRQELEVKTEQTIVEKLEEARMEEERQRVQRLFGEGNGFTASPSQQQAQPVQQQPLQQSIQVNPAPVKQEVVVKEVIREVPAPVAAAPERDVREEIRAEIRALKDTKAQQESAPNRMYVSGGLGTATYPGVINMRGNLSTGFQIGVENPNNRTILEGGFVYSSLLIESVDLYSPFPAFKDLKQYNIGVAAKYMLTTGMFRPVLGGALSYTRRTYSDRQYSYIPTQEVSTDAFDLGIVGGLEVAVSDTMSIGLDIRYMFNIGYRDDSAYMQSFVNPQPGAVVEKRNYYTSLLTARIAF